MEASLVLQLLLDRLFKRLISIEAAENTFTMPRNSEVALTLREQNAVRYMAGYVAIKLNKKFQKKAKHPELRRKWEFFVQVLSSMEADQQVDDVESIEDYTSTWVDLIDHGGLYQVKDEVIYGASRFRYAYMCLHTFQDEAIYSASRFRYAYMCLHTLLFVQLYTLMVSIEVMTRHHLRSNRLLSTVGGLIQK